MTRSFLEINTNAIHLQQCRGAKISPDIAVKCASAGRAKPREFETMGEVFESLFLQYGFNGRHRTAFKSFGFSARFADEVVVVMVFVFGRHFVDGCLAADIHPRDQADFVKKTQVSVDRREIGLIFQGTQKRLCGKWLFRLQCRLENQLPRRRQTRALRLQGGL